MRHHGDDEMFEPIKRGNGSPLGRAPETAKHAKARKSKWNRARKAAVHVGRLKHLRQDDE